MTTETNLGNWIGQEVMDSSGDRIGKVAEIYLDDETGQPEWMAVTTGWFGSNVSFVPLTSATPGAGGIQVPWDKAKVKDAPNAQADGSLSQEEEARLYAHYGVNYGESRSDSGLPEGGAPRQTATDTNASQDNAMTRSEEELEVGTARREAGRVRLRKWVETEHVTRTVPVTHEEVRIEREPITDGNIDAALAGPEIRESEHEVVLHEEEVVTNKQVVPKERVRLDKEVVTEQETVTEELRKEHVEVDGDPKTTRNVNR